MKYYNENTVKQIVKDAMNYGLTISQNIPMDINSYPSVDIKEPHGRLGDLDELKALQRNIVKDVQQLTTMALNAMIVG